MSAKESTTWWWRLRATTRIRVLLIPALAFVLLVEIPVYAVWGLWPAAKEWWWHADPRGPLHDWYRQVYRPARYGSVYDLSKRDTETRA